MIKGKSIIQLTNVKTGKTEVYENENMLTNLINILPKPMNYYSAFSKFEYPIYKNVFGGILLFPEVINENADTIFPSGSNVPFACAGNITNSGSRTDLGSYNSTESGVQENGSIKMVWDFSTSQANGTLKSLSLTSGLGGICGYGSSTNTTTEYVTTNLAYQIKYFNNSKGANDRPLLVNYDTNKLYVWSYISTRSSTLEIKEYNIALKSLKLNTTGLVSSTYKAQTIQLNSALQNLYPFYCNTLPNGKCYFLFGNSNGNCASSSKFYVLEIDMFNNYSTRVYEITNNTGQELKLAIQSSAYYHYSIVANSGYIYIQNTTTYDMFKIKLTDSTDTTKIITNSGATQEFHYQLGDFIYFGCYNKPLMIYNTSTDTWKYMNGANGTSFNKLSNQVTTSWAVPILIGGKETPFFIDGGASDTSTLYNISFLTNYMATINNLASAVTKTADNTMKIIYTLTQV